MKIYASPTDVYNKVLWAFFVSFFFRFHFFDGFNKKKKTFQFDEREENQQRQVVVLVNQFGLCNINSPGSSYKMLK